MLEMNSVLNTPLEKKSAVPQMDLINSLDTTNPAHQEAIFDIILLDPEADDHTKQNAKIARECQNIEERITLTDALKEFLLAQATLFPRS